MSNDLTNQAKLANPAPLGLFSFALTTILLNLHNLGLFGVDVMIMGMGIFFGGMTQMIAGVMEYKKGNTFGTVAFTSYGAFWISLVFIWIAPYLGLPPVDSVSMGSYLAIWGVFSVMMFIGTLSGALIGKLIFGSLVILITLLAIGNFASNPDILQVAGFFGVLCGSLAFYEAAAIIINGSHNRKILPI